MLIKMPVRVKAPAPGKYKVNFISQRAWREIKIPGIQVIDFIEFEETLLLL